MNELGGEIKKESFKSLLMIEIKEFSLKDSASYYNVIGKKVDIIRDSYYASNINVFESVLKVLFIIIFLSNINYLLCGIILISSIPLIINNTLFPKKISKKYAEYLDENENVFIKIKDYFLGFKPIKIHRAEKFFLNKFNTAVNKETKRLNEMYLLNNLSGIIAYFGVLCSQFLGAIYAAYLVLTGKLSFGVFLAVFQVASNINESIISCINSYILSKSVKSIADEIYELNEIKVQNEFKMLPELNNDIGIELKNLTFSYPNKETLFNKINFAFEKNKKYLIIGESGCGKTTLIKILLKEIDVESGNVLFNNVNITDISSSILYGILTYVPQNAYLFNTSVKENIDLRSEYSEDEVAKVMSMVKLKEFLEKQKDYLNQIINEETNTISGGEKSRFGLARAIIENKNIIICDEVLSSLDKENSNYIEEFLLSLKNVLLIHVSHKSDPDLMKKYDYVLKFENKCLNIVYKK